MLAAFSVKAMLDYKSVIHRIAQVLVPGKRFVFLELVQPERALRLLGYYETGGNRQG